MTHLIGCNGACGLQSCALQGELNLTNTIVDGRVMSFVRRIVRLFRRPQETRDGVYAGLEGYLASTNGPPPKDQRPVSPPTPRKPR
jgi:hypothetical protein